MHALSNSAIEPGIHQFKVSMTLFGTMRRPASKQIVTVLASTKNGAKRIVRSFYPRSSSHEVIEKPA
jgi:hypothetical protein